LIDEIPGRTTGEERAQLLRVAPAAAPPFDRAAICSTVRGSGDGGGREATTTPSSASTADVSPPARPLA